jgi:hypothetical protein
MGSSRGWNKVGVKASGSKGVGLQQDERENSVSEKWAAEREIGHK